MRSDNILYRISITSLVILALANSAVISNAAYAKDADCVGGVDYLSNPSDQGSAAFEMLDKYSQLGVMFYDPCADGRAKNNTVYRPIQDPEEITLIGGATAQKAIADFKTVSKATGNNFLTNLNTNYSDDSNSAINAINTLIDNNSLQKYVIISASEAEIAPKEIIEQKIHEIETKVSSARTIILVTAYDKVNDYSAVNQVIKDQSQEWNNIIVADWEDFAKNNSRPDDLFEEDGKTLSEYGSKQWAKFVYSAIPGNSSLQNNQSNESVVWNYFTDSTNSEIYESMPAVAGIMTNIQIKSNYNPFYFNPTSGEIGLFAQKDQELKQLLEQNDLANYWNQEPEYAIREKAIQLELDYYTGKLGKTNAIARAYKNYADSHDSKRTSYHDYENAKNLFEYFSELNHERISDTETKQFLANAKSISLKNQTDRIARDIFIINSGTNTSTIGGAELASSSENPINHASNQTPQWSDGWISAGFIGFQRNSALQNDYQIKDASYAHSYSTIYNDKQSPNKITLYMTEENLDLDESPLDLYDGRPPHFTVDLKAHKTYQHLPINYPATAFGKNNRAAGVQIAIIGEASNDAGGILNDSFITEDDWEYLARLLYVISSEIELDSVHVNISDRTLSETEFKNFNGIVLAGHMSFSSSSKLTEKRQTIIDKFKDMSGLYGEI